MPADVDELFLDELFTALGAHADRMAIGTAEQARRLARRRRYRRTVAAVAVLVLSAGGVAAITVVADRPEPPAAPTPKPTVTFVPLQPAGSLPMELSDAGPSGPRRNSVTIIDSVAYVLGGPRPGIPTRVGALDLATGQPLFPTVDLGPSLGTPQLTASRAALVVQVPRQVGGTSAIFVLDPATGAVRWRLDDESSTGLNALHTDSVLVTWDSSGGGPLVGRDWQTGAERWRGPSPRAGGTVRPVLPADFALPATSLWPTVPTDRLLVEVEDGHVHVIDTSTGATVQRIDIRHLPIQAAVGDTLYVGGGGKVWAYPLDRPGEATLIYSDEYGREASLYPCGIPVRCLSQHSDAGGGTIVLDPVTHRTRWHSTTNRVRHAVGDRLLDDDGLLYDLSGRRLGEPVTHDLTWWLTPGSLLTLDVEPGFDTAAVGGMNAEDGSTVRLGEIPTPLARGNGCAVDRQYLVCPTADGFQAWRFATP